MPVFYLKQNLTIGGVLHKKHTLDCLETVSEKSRRGLVDKGLVLLLETPPVSIFEPLAKYATMLSKAGIETLGDFAFADIDRLDKRKAIREDLRGLQVKAKALIHPDNALPKEDDCGCGESPINLPIHEA